VNCEKFEGKQSAMSFKMSFWEQSGIVRWLEARTALSPPVGESRFFAFLGKVFARGASERASSGVFLLGARWLLASLPFFAVFFPRIHLGVLGNSSVDLRGEDLWTLLLALLLFWDLAFRHPPFEIPSVESGFLIFLIVAEFSIFFGVAIGTVDKPLVSLLYLLKWSQYFMVFFLTMQIAARENQASFFLKVFFLFGIVIAGYGYYEHCFPYTKALYPNYYRLFERAPFHGDANHIGGFLVLWIGFFSGIFSESKKRAVRGILLTAMLFAFFPLVWTYSRKSYFALAGCLAAALFLVRGKKRILLVILLFTIAGLVLPTRLAERLLDLPEAMTSSDPFHSSWAGNWVMWKESLQNTDRLFFLGSGLGSRHRLYYESQYVLILAETGIVGVAAFAFLCVTLVLKMGSYLIRRTEETGRGIAEGWLIGFVGILIHSASCVSWTVAKIAIPFWFLTGAVLGYFRENMRGGSRPL
jgi:O-antigen ligase